MMNPYKNTRKITATMPLQAPLRGQQAQQVDDPIKKAAAARAGYPDPDHQGKPKSQGFGAGSGNPFGGGTPSPKAWDAGKFQNAGKPDATAAKQPGGSLADPRAQAAASMRAKMAEPPPGARDGFPGEEEYFDDRASKRAADAAKYAKQRAEKEAHINTVGKSIADGMDEADPSTPEGMTTSAKGDPKKNPGPGWSWDGESSAWEYVGTDDYPGVATDDPGWFYDESSGEWKYDPDKATGDNIKDHLAEVLGKDSSEYGLSDEELKSQEDKAIKAAAQAKANLSQTMAGRGFGASGLVGSGFGDIDSKASQQVGDIHFQNSQLGIEARLNELKTISNLYGTQLSEEQRMAIFQEMQALEKEKFGYQKDSDSEADQWTGLHNILADLGGEQWAADTLAWAMAEAKKGTPFEKILEQLGLSDGTVVGDSSPNTQSGAAPGFTGADPNTTLYPDAPPGYEGDWTQLSEIKRKEAWASYHENYDFVVPD